MASRGWFEGRGGGIVGGFFGDIKYIFFGWEAIGDSVLRGLGFISVRVQLAIGENLGCIRWGKFQRIIFGRKWKGLGGVLGNSWKLIIMLSKL